MKKAILIFLTVFLSFCLFGCVPDEPAADNMIKVMVSADSGATVIGENPRLVAPGESVTFKVDINNTSAFLSTTEGVYDISEGTLTVSSVSERMNIIFRTQELGYDTTKTINYIFRGEDGDTTSVTPSPYLRYGTEITLRANNTQRIFAGWTIGKSLNQGADLISQNREYTFRVSPDLVPGNSLYIYANYVDSNVFYYDANGGMINTESDNMAINKYYTAELSGSKVMITMGEKYFNYAVCASTFYDDGTFYRSGHVLLEYNTKPDGTGESIGLGSKFYTAGADGFPTLYCIWAKDSNHADFKVSSYDMPRPSSIKEANSENWNTKGVIIESYTGDDDRVVIPEYIKGKPVIAIASGAFNSKKMTELVISNNLLKIEDGAFQDCSSLETVYFSDCIYEMSDEAFDGNSYKNLKNLYVNATIAPRAGYSYGVKFCRLLSTQAKNRIIVVGGSSSYQGLGTEYLEALLEGDYAVVNLGTVRTTHGLMVLEAMGAYTHEGDVVVYAPENSSYLYGERELYWKTLHTIEGMYNIFRHVDISNYTGIFSAFSDFNKTKRYTTAPGRYEKMCDLASMSKYGDNLSSARGKYNDPMKYTDVYYITLNEMVKTKYGGEWNDKASQDASKDYTDPNNLTWCSIKNEDMRSLFNYSIKKAKSSGAKVYFGFAPVDAMSLVDEAKSLDWLDAYDAMMRDEFEFDGIVGSSKNYIFSREYFYDCAYHTNDYGRTYRTYNLYCDLADILGIEDKCSIYDKGIKFEGCLFESGSLGSPNIEVDFLIGGDE